MENTNTKPFYITDDLLATQGQRFVNYLIDMAVQYLIAILLGILSVLIAELTNSYALTDWIENMNTLESYLLGAVILVFYYGVTETFLSRSIGKFFTKTIVVLEDGSKPDAATILKRTFCRLIPFEQFSFFGTRGWHDSISDTYVVQKAAFEEKRKQFYEFDQIGAGEETH